MRATVSEHLRELDAAGVGGRVGWGGVTSDTSPLQAYTTTRPQDHTPRMTDWGRTQQVCGSWW